MTGRAGTQHTARMMEYGTTVVGGVTPGKGGRSHLKLPIFDSMKTAAADMSKFMIGDEIVCDSQNAVPGANNDRFEGTILGFDTVQSFVTLSTTMTGLITANHLSCAFMGDAVKVQGVMDSNGQAIRTTWGNKTSLQAVGIVR
jgi:hypothetical protein